MRRIRILAAMAAIGLTLAACASNDTESAAGGGTTTSSAETTAATVSTANVGDLGTVLVDGQGLTLYLFTNDQGSTSTCSGSCASTWPALTTSGDATVRSGAEASMLGTTTRDDGTTQVTYNDHPLYLYSGDSAPGQANGQGIGDVWYAVTTQGTPATEVGGMTGGGTNGGGGYGNGYG